MDKPPPTAFRFTARRAWVGSPSTNKMMTFSSTANRHIINSQEIPSDPPEVFSRAIVGRPKLQADRKRELKQTAKNMQLEPQWAGSPANYKPLTVSTSSNSVVYSIPGYDASKDPHCPFSRSKKFMKQQKRLAQMQRKDQLRNAKKIQKQLAERKALAAEKVLKSRERRLLLDEMRSSSSSRRL